MNPLLWGLRPEDVLDLWGSGFGMDLRDVAQTACTIKGPYSATTMQTAGFSRLRELRWIWLETTTHALQHGGSRGRAEPFQIPARKNQKSQTTKKSVFYLRTSSVELRIPRRYLSMQPARSTPHPTCNTKSVLECRHEEPIPHESKA